MNAHAYTCSVCKMGVAVLDGRVIRACKCVGPIHANMDATASLLAGMALKPASPVESK